MDAAGSHRFGEVRERAQGIRTSAKNNTTLITVISVLSVGLVIGLIALAYFWKKSNKEKSRRKDVERSCNIKKAPVSRPMIKKQNPGVLAAQLNPETKVQLPSEVADDYPSALTLAKQDGGDDIQFANEQDKYTDEVGRKGRKRQGQPDDYVGSVKKVTEAEQEIRNRQNKKGGINFKYRNLGGFTDVGNVHPKNDYKKDESNQCLWDIVMVRLSLINEDFVHKSRYLSGQPFGFKHDILVAPVAEDDWEEEEVDSYESGKSGRQGTAF